MSESADDFFLNSCHSCAYYNYSGNGNCGLGLDCRERMKRFVSYASNNKLSPCYSWTDKRHRPNEVIAERCCFWDYRSNGRVEQCPKELREIADEFGLEICHFEIKREITTNIDRTVKMTLTLKCPKSRAHEVDWHDLRGKIYNYLYKTYQHSGYRYEYSPKPQGTQYSTFTAIRIDSKNNLHGIKRLREERRPGREKATLVK